MLNWTRIDWSIINERKFQKQRIKSLCDNKLKTMLAKYTARICQENNWTFMYVSKAAHFCHAYQLAKLFKNTVIFIEDINRATDGERDENIDDILNVFDGVDTKDAPIISIFTSNDENDIHKGFMRAGRIDTVIPMKPIDQSSSMKFINKFCVDINGNSLLYDGMDYSAAAKAFIGISPAFVKSIIDKVKIVSITNKNEGEKILPEDIVDLVGSHKDHIKMTEEDENREPEFKAIDHAIKFLEEFGLCVKKNGKSLDITVDSE